MYTDTRVNYFQVKRVWRELIPFVEKEKLTNRRFESSGKLKEES